MGYADFEGLIPEGGYVLIRTKQNDEKQWLAKQMEDTGPTREESRRAPSHDEQTLKQLHDAMDELRHPSFLGPRDDKDAQDAVKEETRQ